MPAARLHLKLWIEKDHQLLLGPGTTELLYLTDTMGSLKKAAEHLHMSYRTAWGRIKRLEEALGLPLLETVLSRRQGCRLTPEGKQAMLAFRAWEEKITAFARAEAPDLGFLQVHF